MVLTDRIMAGVYRNFFEAVREIAKNEGFSLLSLAKFATWTFF